MLLPGTHLLRRSPGWLQVGLTPGRSITTPESVPREDADHRALAAGLAMHDDRPLRAALPAHDATPRWHRHQLAALGRRHADSLPDALAARARHVVEIEPFGHDLDHDLVTEATALCARAGLRRPGRRKPGPGPKERTVPVGLLLGVGEPHREQLDPWVRTGRAHLVLRWVEGEVLLGPFVVPGTTACLRCVDAHLAEADPAWPLLVEQYARASRRDRPDGVPEPVDAATAATAVAWAVADLATYVEGGRPTTLGATVTITDRMESLTTTVWRRHPGCGCDWS